MGCCSSQLVDTERIRTPENVTPTSVIQRELQEKRDAFWEATSTYEGRSEVWGKLRTACETTDINQAQNIVNSLNLSVPTGHLSDGCYDDLGNRYLIPIYCFVEPTNLIHTSNDHLKNLAITSERGLTNKKGSNDASFSTQIPIITITEHVESESEPEISYEPKAEPVYTPSSTTIPGEKLIVRLNTEKDVHIKVDPEDTMMMVKSKLCALQSVDLNSVNIRFVYLGKILEDNTLVKDINVSSGGVIQALMVSV